MVVRREETQRNLRGRNQENPLEMTSGFRLGPAAPLSISGPQNARGIEVNMDAAGQVMQGLAQFGSKTIREAAKIRYNKQVMQGAMEYQQGTSADDLGGFDKRWMLEGYRQMDAATSSSALLAAQKAEISQGLYESDPEQFREIYARRLEIATQGKDERTIDLMTQQMMEQMPTLVAEHTSQHMGYLERKATSSLETSIDVMSRTGENTAQLLAFAKGEQGSTGLSTEARRKAVISGVARAYDNDNPAAFAILNQQGVLGELSSEEQGTLRAAQARFESRRRSEYDEDFFRAEQEILEGIKTGQYVDPMNAIDAMAELYESRGLTITAAEANQTFEAADQSNEIHHGATVLELETARTQGDYTRMADLTGPYIIDIESNGNRNAVSPTGAKSEWQVMDKTNADPGFGVRPAANDTLAERARVGRDYWRAMVQRYTGDLEAAAVAYNAGPGNADNWLAAGRDFDAAKFTSNAARDQARDYVGKLNSRIGGERYAQRASNRYARAEQEAQIVKDSLAIDLYAATQPQFEALDTARINGDITDADWRRQKDAIRMQYGVQQTKATVDTDIRVNREALSAETARAEKAAKDATDAAAKQQATVYAENLQTFGATDTELQAVMEAEMERITNMPDFDANGEMLDPQEKVLLQMEQMQAVRDEYQVSRTAAAQALGVEVKDLGMPETTKYIIDSMNETLNAAMESSNELSDIQVATQRGTLDTLSPKAQDRAWGQFQESVTTKYANMPPPSNQAEAEQRMTQMDAEFTAWYAKTGFVPKEVREQASAALTSQLLTENNEPDPYAVESALDYMRLKSQSKHAADNYLNPEAQVVAEAILSITGGREETVPMTIQRLGMASGQFGSSTGAQERDPAYMARSEVRSAIKTNVSRSTARGFFSELFGGRGAGLAVRAEANPEAERAITSAIEGRVAAIHAVNPNIPPQHVVDLATESVQQQMAVINGELIVDPTGRDLYNDVFGASANNYRQNPRAIETALKGYITSTAFKNNMASIGMSLEPNPTLLDTVAGVITSGLSMGMVDAGLGLDYSVEAAGNGSFFVNFSIDPTQAPITIPIRASDVGAWWTAQEKSRRTRN